MSKQLSRIIRNEERAVLLIGVQALEKLKVGRLGAYANEIYECVRLDDVLKLIGDVPDVYIKSAKADLENDVDREANERD